MKIQNSAGEDSKWQPDVFHRVHPSVVNGLEKLWWKLEVGHPMLTQAPGISRYFGQGIMLLGGTTVERTIGEPVSARRVLDAAPVEKIAREVSNWFGDVNGYMSTLSPLLLATVLTESRGNVKAERYEAHLDDFSFGPCQILTKTATQVHANLKVHGITLPDPPAAKRWIEWREYLNNYERSLLLCAGYHCMNNTDFECKCDPVLLYAAYNAGSPRPSRSLPWGLVYYDRDGAGPQAGALDHFVDWFGDACFVLSENRSSDLSQLSS